MVATPLRCCTNPPGSSSQYPPSALVFSGYCWRMKKVVVIEIDDDLVQEAVHRYCLADAREAVHLALRTLLQADGAGDGQQDDEYDEFSDLSAWQPHRSGESG